MNLNSILVDTALSIFILIWFVCCCNAFPPARSPIGSMCQTKKGENGICKLASECNWFMEGLRNKQLNGDEAHCDFKGNESVVCCKDSLSAIFVRTGVDTVPSVPLQPLVKSIPKAGAIFSNRIEEVCQHYVNESELFFKISGPATAANVGDFPHMVALFKVSTESGKNLTFVCGGSLISKQYILTAAHCMTGRSAIDIPSIVRVGHVNISQNIDYLAPTDFKISKIISHKDYDPLTNFNDIALIKLEQPVGLAHSVFPACLNTDLNDVAPEVPLYVTGWGATRKIAIGPINILLKSNVTTMNLAQCNETLVAINKKIQQPRLASGLIEGQLCTYDPAAMVGACEGDSGGPLPIHYQVGINKLIGIVSYGQACASKHPSVYTRVAQYIDWIYENVDDFKQRARVRT